MASKRRSDPSSSWWAIVQKTPLSTVRLDFTQAGDDPAFDALLEELSAGSAVFVRLWHSPEISHFLEGVYTYEYPGIGAIAFEHTAYAVASNPNLRLLMFSPADDDSTRRFAQLPHSPA